MTPKPAVNAAIISTDLEPKLVRSMAKAARAAGFDRVITLDALPSLEATGEGAARENHLPESLKGVSVVVLDEWIGGRSAFELLMNMRAHPDIPLIPVCLLCSDPSGFAVSAYFAAGVTSPKGWIILRPSNVEKAQLALNAL